MKRRKPWRHMLTVSALAAVTAAAGQWSFQLDTSFRTSILHQNVNSLMVLEDGMLMASGIMRFPGEMSDKRLVRLSSIGTRDDTFYASGLGGGNIKPWQVDRFYVQGSFVPRRISSNTGENDGTFAVGSGAIPYFLPLQGGDYHVYPDGSVLVSGQHLLSDSIRGFEGLYDLIWFTHEGYLDTTRTHRQSNGVMWDFTALPDGKFLCSCTCTQYEGQPVDRLFRIHADGSLDTTFNSGVNWGNIYAYHPLPDGRVYVGGRFKRAAAPDDTLYLARFMPDGSLDPTFNNSTHLDTDPGITGGTKVTRIVPWMDDKLFVMGVLQQVNGEPRGGLCVLDTTGQLLPLLDECMTGAFSYQGSTNASIHGIVPIPDSSGFYIHGTYAGYTDGNTNDPQQRFVSRLLVSELSTAVEEQAAPTLRMYPNPANASSTLELVHVPPAAYVVLCDALGRVALKHEVRNFTTTLDLHPLAGGLYTITLYSGAHRVATQRLVVQR